MFKHYNDIQKDKFKSMHLKRRREPKMGTFGYHKACCRVGSV